MRVTVSDTVDNSHDQFADRICHCHSFFELPSINVTKEYVEIDQLE